MVESIAQIKEKNCKSVYSLPDAEANSPNIVDAVVRHFFLLKLN